MPGIHRNLACLLLLAVLPVVLGCTSDDGAKDVGGDSTTAPDVAEPQPDPAPDSGLDAASDAAADGAAETAADADAAAEATPEPAADTAGDVADAPAEAMPDVPADTSADPAGDPAAEAAPDPSADAATEASEDVPADAVTELPAGDASPETDSGGAPTREAMGLRFINSREAGVSVLRYQVGLTGTMAANLVAHRDGADGLWGTADDDPYDDLDEIDGVDGVGEKSVDRIVRFGMNFAEGQTDPMLVFLSDPATTEEVLQQQVGFTALAAQNLVQARNGADGVPGTADDVVFRSRGEIEAVPYVGFWSMRAVDRFVKLGRVEPLSSFTSSRLMAVTFFAGGSALVGGVPGGQDPHVLLYSPVSDQAYTTDDDPYQITDVSSDVKTPLYGAASDPVLGIAITGGNGGEIYRFDSWLGTFTPVAVPAPGMFRAFLFSPDGGHALFLDMDSGTLFNYDVGLDQVAAWGAAPISSFAFLDGQNLFGAGDGGSLWKGTGDTWITVQSDAQEDLFRVVRTPLSGGLFAVGEWGVGLGAALDADQVSVTRVPTRSLTGLKDAAFAPPGDYALLVGDHGTILRYVVATGQITPLVSGVTVDLEAVAFAPDGSEALIVGDAGTILRYTPPAAE